MTAIYTPAGELLDKARRLTRPQTTDDELLRDLLALNSNAAQPAPRGIVLQACHQALIERDERRRGNGATLPGINIPTPPTGREFMAKQFPPRKRVLVEQGIGWIQAQAGQSAAGHGYIRRVCPPTPEELREDMSVGALRRLDLADGLVDFRAAEP